jgi:hypothetical protein
MSIVISGTGTSGGTVTAGAFNTNPAASGTFIPTIWSGKLNVKFYSTTVFGEISNTSYEGDIKNLGDTVNINNIPDIVIGTYTVGQTLAYQVPTPNIVQLQISQAKYFGVNVSDVIAYQSQPKLMDMFTSDAGKQMAISIDTTIMSNSFVVSDVTKIAAGNSGTVAGVRSGSFNVGGVGGVYNAVTNPFGGSPLTLTTANVLQAITNLASILDEQNIPDERFLLITPFVRNLLMNSPLQQAYLTGDGQSVLRNGKIGKIDRFTVYVSNLIPVALAGQDFDGSTTGTGIAANAVQRRCIVAGHTAAITFASQIAKVEALPNPQDFGQLIRGLNIFGFKTLKPQAIAMVQHI